jgi:hypothetical protein
VADTAAFLDSGPALFDNVVFSKLLQLEDGMGVRGSRSIEEEGGQGSSSPEEGGRGLVTVAVSNTSSSMVSSGADADTR